MANKFVAKRVLSASTGQTSNPFRTINPPERARLSVKGDGNKYLPKEYTPQTERPIITPPSRTPGVITRIENLPQTLSNARASWPSGRRAVYTTDALGRKVVASNVANVGPMTNVRAAESLKLDSIFVEFPFGPQDLQHSSHAARIQQVQRPGLPPLLVTEGRSLRVCSFSATIAKRGGGTDAALVEGILENLSLMAENGVTLEFEYGFSKLDYDCVMTNLTMTDRYRDQNGYVTRAEVSITLTERPRFNADVRVLKAVFKSDDLTAGIPDGSGNDKVIDLDPRIQADSNFRKKTFGEERLSPERAAELVGLL